MHHTKRCDRPLDNNSTNAMEYSWVS